MPHYAPFRYAQEAKISRTKFSPPPTYVDDVYNLYIRYVGDGDWQRYPLSHIPKSVQPAFDEGLVEGIHLEFLPLNGAASWALPGSPRSAVLGVVLKDGTRIECVPPALVKVFKKKLFEAICVLIAGAALSRTPYAWFAGVLFGYGAYRLAQAVRLPRKSALPSPT